MFYVIKNRGNGKLVTGTDFSYGRRQMMRQGEPPLIISDYDGELPENIAHELKHRGINQKAYKIIPVEIKEV